MAQIIAPVPHSTFIQTITRCAQNTRCNSKMGEQINYSSTTDSNLFLQSINHVCDSNNNDFNTETDLSTPMDLYLDFFDLGVDEDALLELAYDLGLNNDKLELPVLKNVTETIMRCIR